MNINKVLIVDDSFLARSYVKRCLEIVGLSETEFLEAQNGEEALNIVKNEEIDLIFTDLNMPVMDGMTLIKKLKSSPRYNCIPIIVISSKSNDRLNDWLKRVDTLKLLQKPVKIPELNEILQQFMENDYEIQI